MYDQKVNLRSSQPKAHTLHCVELPARSAATSQRLEDWVIVIATTLFANMKS